LSPRRSLVLQSTAARPLASADIDAYGLDALDAIDLHAPQLGEYAWHTVTGDVTVDAASAAHEATIVGAVKRHLRPATWQGLRVLEVAAYRHHTLHGLADRLGAECVLADISPTSLVQGLTAARRTGVKRPGVPVVADFHDLPFSDGWFDVAYVSAAVHHTWHPEVVLGEMARVVAPGGLLVLEGEQCARVCCFYAFRSNRAEALTPFEQVLSQHRLLETISSPFWGSRPEAVFGMTENDRIPIGLWRAALGAAGTIEELRLDTDRLVGPLEQQLLALDGEGAALGAQVRAVLAGAVDVAAAHHGPLERALGYRLPTAGDVHAVARNVGHALGALRRGEDDPAFLVADLFGAGVGATVRRAGERAERDRPLFRRPVREGADGVWTEPPSSGALAARITTPLLPDVFDPAARDDLAAVFPPTDWLPDDSAGSVTLVNLHGRARVEVGARDRALVLLVRYYAVLGAGDAPYRVRVVHAGGVLAEDLVLLQETRLVRALLPPGVAEVAVEIVDGQGVVVDAGWQLRVSVFQLVDVQT
jgi:SAM-dependent methyltransferase